jgi:putative phosphoribosyl transferase
MITYAPQRPVDQGTVNIQIRGAELNGTLLVPPDAQMIVIFVQANGSCCQNPRNHYLAHCLHKFGLATLLVDLLTLPEQVMCSRAESLHCDLTTFSRRLIEVTEWLRRNPATTHFQIGYFGLHEGSNIACLAAAAQPAVVDAIVAPSADLGVSELALPHIQAPTLLVIGDQDQARMAANYHAIDQLPASSRMVLIPRSGELFHDSSTLEFVSRLSSEWFKQHMKVRVTAAIKSIPDFF